MDRWDRLGGNQFHALDTFLLSLSAPSKPPKVRSEMRNQVLELTIEGKEKAWNPESLETVTAEPTIHILFFKKDENQHVETVKVEDINFEKMIQHLNQGESILITRKCTSKEKPALNVDEEMSKPWYFTHI